MTLPQIKEVVLCATLGCGRARGAGQWKTDASGLIAMA
jgi:hypothetical protein